MAVTSHEHSGAAPEQRSAAAVVGAPSVDAEGREHRGVPPHLSAVLAWTETVGAGQARFVASSRFMATVEMAMLRRMPWWMILIAVLSEAS